MRETYVPQNALLVLLLPKHAYGPQTQTKVIVRSGPSACKCRAYPVLSCLRTRDAWMRRKSVRGGRGGGGIIAYSSTSSLNIAPQRDIPHSLNFPHNFALPQRRKIYRPLVRRDDISCMLPDLNLQRCQLPVLVKVSVFLVHTVLF